MEERDLGPDDSRIGEPVFHYVDAFLYVCTGDVVRGTAIIDA